MACFQRWDFCSLGMEMLVTPTDVGLAGKFAATAAAVLPDNQGAVLEKVNYYERHGHAHGSK